MVTDPLVEFRQRCKTASKVDTIFPLREMLILGKKAGLAMTLTFGLTDKYKNRNLDFIAYRVETYARHLLEGTGCFVEKTEDGNLSYICPRYGKLSIEKSCPWFELFEALNEWIKRPRRERC